MITEHFSEEELQLFATGKLPQDAGMLQHMESCVSCQEQIAVYRLIVEKIKEQPTAAFDFDLTDAVLQQLQPVKTKAVNNNFYAFMPVVLIAILVITSLYIFRKNFLALSAGISSFFLAISMIACIAIISFKVIKLYRQYQLQLKKLNFSE